MERLSRAQARRVALAAQGFNDPAPTGRVDRRHLRRAMSRMQLLQLDSVPVVIRSQYLPLFSRLGPYEPGMLDRLAYRDGEWFEAWAHQASVLPVETEPLLRWVRERAAAGEIWRGLYRLASEEPDYVESVRRQVEERGPLSPGELTDPRPRSGAWWGSRSVGSLALDWLFRIGVVGVRRSPSFEKSFDLIERVVSAEILDRPSPRPEEAQRALVQRAAQASGVATEADLADYFRMSVRETRARIAELCEDGHLVEVEVEGWPRRAYLSAEAARPRRTSATALLSPFDPVVWNRERAERLFSFDYRIEIYTPAAKRRHGYYVLPFLFGDRLVARVDLKTDRQVGVLRVLAAFAEPDVDLEQVGSALTAELEGLAQLVGVEGVVVGSRGDLIGHVRPTG